MDEKSDWFLASGASSHMSPERKDFHTYRELKESIGITIADGESLHTVGMDDIHMQCLQSRIVKIVDALHIPGLDRRLLSAAILTLKGLTASFGTKECTIFRGKESIATVPQAINVYRVKNQAQTLSVIDHQERPRDWKLWHARLGHTHHENTKRVVDASDGIPGGLQRGRCQDLCGGCMLGTKTVMQFPKQTNRGTTRVLQLVHTDLMRPMKVTSTGGAKYVLLFTDDYSRYICAHFLKSKTEVTNRFRDYKAKMEVQLGARIKIVRSDNRTEFYNKKLSKISVDGGIIHQRSAPCSPQQNGLAERTNRTVMEMARSTMMFKAFETRCWADAVNTGVYLSNRMSSTVNTDITP
ncbi:FOG: Transposon-encoded proteins with TYA, reverse transcriptase, integrase domains in various combinations [Plasmopara halstedii]|uniref:FOG: Transposon-encoded proteins with TYA, reverse transcriptase, integrase domains in various combinations n=1 Tax=Plasmopara halstedii TaxID=4781 RepID=A0A0P1AQ44_PLAHL|nr:FOG: Transposon-encoded proteins with TYA, reverse transcriptase, integrase domains in various combinations [Plasmopara halstedii]CEG43429.1 FOG: Transposon-encoded proteins with TYA, reverse transcriptase, integrase domains in various combinations [Plasmopara halstedii]|eukprot:XP_024579798.1 FOG: Transposon-encoded proteins with TYA, reverse transcriptase, integrase domains in various combinations [Plasmopara halstedii]